MVKGGGIEPPQFHPISQLQSYHPVVPSTGFPLHKNPLPSQATGKNKHLKKSKNVKNDNDKNKSGAGGGVEPPLDFILLLPASCG